MGLGHDLLGIGAEPKDLSALQVSARGLVVFVAALIMVRISAKRFLGRKTAFDIILLLVLGSTLARAINGSGPFLGSLVVGFVLILLHRLIALLAVRYRWFGRLVKGTDSLIITDGQIQEDVLRKHHLSHDDLMEDLRLDSVTSPSKVKEARLERSGDISIIKKDT
jgi:uncharacterized membrane protein YcaP (DUF421 family)